jgi:hypothetical protein
LARYEEYLRRELQMCFRQALETALDNEIRCVGERLRDKLLILFDEAQKQVFYNYHASKNSDVELHAEKVHDEIRINGDGSDLATIGNFAGASDTPWNGDSQTYPESLPSTFEAFAQTKTTFSTTFEPEEPFIQDQTPANGEADFGFEDVSGFGAPNLDLPIMHNELGQLNFVDEQWTSSRNEMDLDLLLFDIDSPMRIGPNIRP